METAPRSADLEHDAEPAPPTARVYVPADESGDRMLHAAVTCPPAGSLEGWTAVDVDAEAWEEFAEARAVYDHAAREAKLAAETVDRTAERLGAEVDRRG